jgi:hypothetical protein
MSMAFDQERLCRDLSNAIFDALRDLFIREEILSVSPGTQGDQGLPSTTPPGSPKLSPKEYGFASPGGILYTGPAGTPYIQLGGLLDATPEPQWMCASDPPRPRCRAFSEPPVSPAPFRAFTITQRCAPPQQQSISRLDAKPRGSQRAQLTRGPSRARALQHHLQSSSGLGYTWFNAYRLTWLNTCGLNTDRRIACKLNACRLTWDPGIRY